MNEKKTVVYMVVFWKQIPNNIRNICLVLYTFFMVQNYKLDVTKILNMYIIYCIIKELNTAVKSVIRKLISIFAFNILYEIYFTVLLHRC